jgi:hypothetical protein
MAMDVTKQWMSRAMDATRAMDVPREMDVTRALDVTRAMDVQSNGCPILIWEFE